MTGFIATDKWTNAVEKGWALGSGDVEAVQEDDIDDLLLCIETGSPGECASALSTLPGLLLGRMSPAQKERLSTLIDQGAERALLGWDGEARCNEAFLSAWFCADRDRAVERILSLDLETLPQESQKAAVYYLGCGNRERAKSRLLDLYNAGGSLGQQAEEALELHGLIVPGPDRIQEVATRWRAEHRWQDLHWLYDYVIERLPPESPIQPILDLLGPPSDGSGGNEYFYSYGEGNVYLEADAKGILRGTHRS
jgi:hypothetical protein